MSIRSLPIIVDHNGFQRRSWEFDYEGVTYYVQETANGYHLLKQTPEGGWQAINSHETQTVVTAFEQENGADRSGLRG